MATLRNDMPLLVLPIMLGKVEKPIGQERKEGLFFSHTGEKRRLHTLSNASTCLCLSF